MTTSTEKCAKFDETPDFKHDVAEAEKLLVEAGIPQ